MKILFMLAFSTSIFCSCRSDKDEGEERNAPLSTEALPLDDFSLPAFSLSNNENVCDSMREFFESYSEKYLVGAETDFDCREVTGQQLFSDEELSLIEKDESSDCAEDRKCYRGHYIVRAGDKLDEYLPLIVVFDNESFGGVIAYSKKNNRALPRKGSSIFSGELLHDNLSRLYETFQSWLKK